MMRTLRKLLVPLILILVVSMVRPGVSASIVTAQVTADSPASHLDSAFWIADAVDLRSQLLAKRISTADWVERINRSNTDFLCLGEMHTAEFRQFMAQNLFPQLNADILMLEASAVQVEELITQVNSSTNSVPLLSADMAAILRTAQSHNPNLQIVGVDQTEQQTAWMNLEQRNSDRKRLSRDGFIAQNIRDQLQSGKRHVALFGSTHCATHDLGLGNSRPFVRHLKGIVRGDRLKSVLLISSTQNNPFTLMLKSLGLDGESLVIPDTKAISPETYNFRWDIKSFFENYDALIYFNER
jgi:hypothetical protein